VKASCEMQCPQCVRNPSVYLALAILRRSGALENEKACNLWQLAAPCLLAESLCS